MGCGSSTPAKAVQPSAATKPPSAAAAAKPASAAAQTSEPVVSVNLKLGADGSVAAEVIPTPTKGAAPGATAPAPTAEAPAAAEVPAGSSSACVLRVICVNDVYELDHMPRLKTAISQLKTENTVVLLAGDFLAPSLLSSLDSGRGMVDVMNDVGIEYVCFGNHEQDIAHKDMLKRIRESKFKWINTNAPTMPLDGVECPPHCAVTATGGRDVWLSRNTKHHDQCAIM